MCKRIYNAERQLNLIYVFTGINKYPEITLDTYWGRCMSWKAYTCQTSSEIPGVW